MVGVAIMGYPYQRIFPLVTSSFVLLFLLGVRSDDWSSKSPGKDHLNDEQTEWLKKGALPWHEYLIPKSREKSLRKEYRTLSPNERHRFHKCLLKLKNTAAVEGGNLSQYDTFVTHHTYDYSPEAHDSPCFLGFHRVFLYILERLMRSHEGCHDMALHYWDTTLDTLLSNPADTVIFNHADYLGNKNGTVDIGFLKDWGPIVPDKCHKYGVNLTRNLCNIQYALLLNQEVDSFVHCGRYEECVFPKSRRFEDAHGQVHNCVGGHMIDLMCAPNDPLFFMYHSFVDLVFQEYIDYNYPASTGIDPREDYPKDTAMDFWKATSTMYPFADFKVIDGLSRNFSDNLVQYEPRPRRCKGHNDCTKGRSNALWCDIRVGQCMAKVILGGSCADYFDEACYDDCDLHQKVFCDKSDYICKCKVYLCFHDSDCMGIDEICEMTTNKCKKTLKIGDFCGKLPDKFCTGVCRGLNEVLKCVKGKCSCKLNAIRCKPGNKLDLCPGELYCEDSGWCKNKVARGETCLRDKMCQNDCYQEYTGVCSRSSFKCQCILKSKLRFRNRKISIKSHRTENNLSTDLSISKNHDDNSCRFNTDCRDRRYLCLRKRSKWGIFEIKKECFLVRCRIYGDCKKKGIRRSRCDDGFCIRG